jgi:chaperonin GroES
MSVHPIRDQVVVAKEKEGEKVSPGGIIHVSVSTTSKNVEGTVLAVGSGRVTMSGQVVPLDVKVGDKILFNPNMATEVQDDGKNFLVLREDAVLCVLR